MRSKGAGIFSSVRPARNSGTALPWSGAKCWMITEAMHGPARHVLEEPFERFKAARRSA